MIFSIGNHIQQIIEGTKTQTRRPTDRYEVGKTYAIQPGRGKKGIPEGRVLILKKWGELSLSMSRISEEDARAEGGYTPDQYEALYDKMYPVWRVRYAYKLKFIPNEEGMPDA